VEETGGDIISLRLYTIERYSMQKMMCTICGHIYDPETGDAGVQPGMSFETVPADWHCPVCGAEKSRFIPAT
jgi:rubredoxin